MSLGQLRILAVTLPTVAVAVLSILWFRNHPRKRRLRADSHDSGEQSATEKNQHTTADTAVSCMPVKADSTPAPDLVEATSTKKPNLQVSVTDPVLEPVTLGAELVEKSDLTPSSPLEVIEKVISKPVESTPKRVEMYDNQVIDTCNKENRSVKVEKSSSVGDRPTILTNSNLSPLKKIENTRKYTISLTEEAYSDLEEGEIRSPNVSLVDTKQSSEEDSVFEREFDESCSKKKDTCSVLEESESELEEGEIRSEDERSEETMKEEQNELNEKLVSLKLEQMKQEEQKALPTLELEQIKVDEGKSASERDSANHSPSEVMLASPSISNFSDAHSEGSTDSGKGQSESAVSPPRTPAGGSSLAGEQAPSLYEFVLPQIIVGRLIGRHGTFLHEIKAQTHTNIFIKRHPDSNKLKICAIEGTQQDIDKALAKIRHKFPLRRFPQLTLEKVSFVQVAPLPPLKPEDFHLTLVEGVNNDVVLSSLVSAAHFFLQQPCHPSYASLAALNSMMMKLYTSGEAPILETPVNYAVCAAPAMGGWYRAQIIQVEEAEEMCTVRFLDYGGYSRIQTSELRQIRGDLLVLPFQAVECYLANVSPPPGEEGWSEEARLFVESLTCGQVLQAQIYDYAEDGVPLVYLYSCIGSQVLLINEELVLRGFGVVADSISTESLSEDGGRTDEETTRSNETTTIKPVSNCCVKLSA